MRSLLWAVAWPGIGGFAETVAEAAGLAQPGPCAEPKTPGLSGDPVYETASDAGEEAPRSSSLPAIPSCTSTRSTWRPTRPTRGSTPRPATRTVSPAPCSTPDAGCLNLPNGGGGGGGGPGEWRGSDRVSGAARRTPGHRGAVAMSASKVVRIFPRNGDAPRPAARAKTRASRDRELIERIARGDTSAHRQIFDLYYGRVLAFVRRRLRDDSLCEEVAADVFFEIWRNAASFRGESQVHSWIFGIAHFKALSARRHQGQLKRSSVVATDQEIMQSYAEDRRSLTETLESRDEMRRTLRALQALPEGQREVIRLAFIEGRSYQEIADELGITEGNVKTRVNRARARLRTTLRRESEGGLA